MTAVAWALLAVLHLLPALALVRPSLLTTLYGVEPGSIAFLLLHHRAALFAVVVVMCLWALADPGVRRMASVAAALSMGSFILLWLGSGSPPALRTIAIADLVGLLPLAWVGWAAFRSA
jgi:hypothetical protein